MRAILSTDAELDLEEIGDDISRINPLRSRDTIRCIRARVREVEVQPRLFQIRPEFGEQIRLARADPYVILFRIHADTVIVERIHHGRRDLPVSFRQT